MTTNIEMVGKIRVVAGEGNRVLFDELRDLDQAFQLARLVANATGWDTVTVLYPRRFHGSMCTWGDTVLPDTLAPGASRRAVKLVDIRGKTTDAARRILVPCGQLIL